MSEIISIGSQSKEIVNYSVSGARKKLYHSSKEPKDGYIKLEMENGKVTYQRFVDGLIGSISYMKIKENDFGGKKSTTFTTFLNSEEQVSAIDIALNKDSYRAFIDAIYNVDFSKEIGVKFYEGKNVNNPSKPYQNCFVFYANETVTIDGKSKNVTPERLDSKTLAPKGIERKSGWDFGDQEDFYFQKMEEIITRFNEYKSKNQIAKSITTAPVQKEVLVGDSDELPF